MSPFSVSRWKLLLLFAATAATAQNPYVGSAACAPCHPAQYAKQKDSHHWNALHSVEKTSFPALFSERPIRERNGVEFLYDTQSSALHVVVKLGEESADASLQWIFGAGALAWTPVGSDSHGYFEHRVSWYRASGVPGMTLGHAATRPLSAQAALGRPTSTEEITRCFQCHAAGVRSGPNLDWIQPGVQCERCHGPGREHAQSGNPKLITVARFSSENRLKFCSTCHRTPLDDRAPAPESKDPMLVRFAPVGLAASRCFLASKTLGCNTCHDPHQDARHDPAFYDGKCQECHLPKKMAFHYQTTGRSCVNCHMRKSTPVTDLTFTDHRIRIYQQP